MTTPAVQAHEIELGAQPGETEHGQLVAAAQRAYGEDRTTWLTSNGTRIAAIVPVEVGRVVEGGQVQQAMIDDHIAAAYPPEQVIPGGVPDGPPAVPAPLPSQPAS